VASADAQAASEPVTPSAADTAAADALAELLGGVSVGAQTVAVGAETVATPEPARAAADTAADAAPPTPSPAEDATKPAPPSPAPAQPSADAAPSFADFRASQRGACPCACLSNSLWCCALVLQR
jgi:hypothetical protein